MPTVKVFNFEHLLIVPQYHRQGNLDIFHVYHEISGALHRNYLEQLGISSVNVDICTKDTMTEYRVLSTHRKYLPVIQSSGRWNCSLHAL